MHLALPLLVAALASRIVLKSRKPCVHEINPMHLHVALLPSLLPANWNKGNSTIAIVIDTLRFTTTACYALTNGARCIEVAAEVDEAVRLRSTREANTLLCGERFCRPISGFDLGNCPYEYDETTVSGKHLIFTTTNGTRAVGAATGASEIWLGAIVNRQAISTALVNASPEQAWFVCSGTDGEVALEDLLVAGAVIEQIGEPESDAGLLACEVWKSLTQKAPDSQAKSDELAEALQRLYGKTSGGSNLEENGYAADLEFAARIDSLNYIPKSTTAGIFQ